MSFKYGQFGAGFKLTVPHPAALRLRETLERRGEDVSVIHLTETGRDYYGQPFWREEKHPARAMVEDRMAEESSPSGTIQAGSVRLYMVPWAAVTPECIVEVRGVRHHVTGIVETSAYLLVEARSDG